MDARKGVSIRLRIGGNELEVSGDYEDVISILDKLLPYLTKIPEHGYDARLTREVKEDSTKELDISMPVISIKKGEPLTSILSKLFDTEWGHKPHPLKEIMDVLESYGLYYPKSSVAVTLNRLVQRGVIRRIKTKDRFYLYVASTPLGEALDE
jgi:hypothetical protein